MLQLIRELRNVVESYLSELDLAMLGCSCKQFLNSSIHISRQDILKLAIKHRSFLWLKRLPVTSDSCAELALANRFKCLKYLFNRSVKENAKFPWDVHVYINAAKSGSLDILKYALKNGCPIDPLVLVTSPDKDCEKYINKHLPNLRTTCRLLNELCIHVGSSTLRYT